MQNRLKHIKRIELYQIQLLNTLETQLKNIKKIIDSCVFSLFTGFLIKLNKIKYMIGI